MVHFTTTVVLATLVIVPAIAAPITQSSEEFEVRDIARFEQEVQARGNRFRRRIRTVESGLNAALGIAATVAAAQGRSYDESEVDIEARGRTRRMGNIVAGVTTDPRLSSIAASMRAGQGRSFEDGDLELEARRRVLRRVGKFASGALGIASNFAALTQGRSLEDVEVSLNGRDFDDLDERDFQDLLDLYTREIEDLD